MNEAECIEAGVDPKKVESLARRFSKLGREARGLGITIFGGSGNGSLRMHDCDDKGALILAEIEGHFDGGDGGCRSDAEGLMRGE